MSLYSAIENFHSDDPLTIAMGVLDATTAIASLLPPPVSIYAETFSGVLGLFMPGEGGPSNLDVIYKVRTGCLNFSKVIMSRDYFYPVNSLTSSWEVHTFFLLALSSRMVLHGLVH